MSAEAKARTLARAQAEMGQLVRIEFVHTHTYDNVTLDIYDVIGHAAGRYRRFAVYETTTRMLSGGIVPTTGES